VSSTSRYIQCGLCGHRHPADRARSRGYIDCSCGMRIETAKGETKRHRLAGTVIGIIVVAAIGGAAYLLARGLG